MNAVMIDCETFGLAPNAAIVTLGAVQFDPHKVDALGAAFHISISLQSSLAHGLTMDARTVLWWLQQSDAARGALGAKLAGSQTLDNALYGFTRYLQQIGTKDEVRVWSCGSRDFEWLESSYRAIKESVPWHYRTQDYRTIRDQFGTKADEPAAGTSHDALSDAIWQAKYLQNVFARMRGEHVANAGEPVVVGARWPDCFANG